MTILSFKSKQVFHQVFQFFSIFSAMKLKTDGDGGGRWGWEKEERRQRRILTEFPECKVSPIRRLWHAKTFILQSRTNSTSINQSAGILTAG